MVLTNPTHYAVALGFDFTTMEAPKVLAKGRNLLAEEIKAEARWAGVPIIENPPLARSLYRSVEVGQSIPVGSLCRGRRHSGLSLPAARGGRVARAPRPRDRRPRQPRRHSLPAQPWQSASGVPPYWRRSAMSTTALAANALPSQSILAAAARIRAASGRHQRDLRHAGAAAGLGSRLPAGALDGGFDHRLPLGRCRFDAPSSFPSFPLCCCC